MSEDNSTEPANAPAPVPASLNETDSGAELRQAVADPSLNEDLALALLKRHDLPPEVLESLSKNGSVIKSRKVKQALVTHPKTPRHVSLPLLRHLFTFDLMAVSLTPVTPADLKMAADEMLVHRLEGISLGERISLARRASGRVASELILDPEPRVIHAALDNPRLSEASVIRGLMRPDAPAGFVHAVCHHPIWSQRREVRIALLRNEKTSLASALEIARSLPTALLREILQLSRLPANVKEHLLRQFSAQSLSKQP